MGELVHKNEYHWLEAVSVQRPREDRGGSSMLKLTLDDGEACLDVADVSELARDLGEWVRAQWGDRGQKTWLVYFVFPRDGRGCATMIPAFTVVHEGIQDEVYAKLPDAPDGRPARQAWYPRVLEDARRVKLDALHAEASAWLETTARERGAARG